jgi:hypothetical protein
MLNVRRTLANVPFGGIFVNWAMLWICGERRASEAIHLLSQAFYSVGSEKWACKFYRRDTNTLEVSQKFRQAPVLR